MIGPATRAWEGVARESWLEETYQYGSPRNFQGEVPVGPSSMASFYRWEKGGPTQGIPLLCVSDLPGGCWAVTQCPEPPPKALAPISPVTTCVRVQGQRERPSTPPPQTGAQQGKAPLHPGRASLRKFVNSGGGGRAPRTSEPRGGARAGARRDHSPEAAKRPEAQSRTPQSAASRRGPGMLGRAGRGSGRADRGALTPPGRE